MAESNKSLTVSYGAFSCTVQGFDDPINTVREIARCFRDLTAEDRHFGAEPPKLDEAALQRLAETASQSGVEPRIASGGAAPEADPTPAAAQRTPDPATSPPPEAPDDSNAAPSAPTAAPARVPGGEVEAERDDSPGRPGPSRDADQIEVEFPATATSPARILRISRSTLEAALAASAVEEIEENEGLRDGSDAGRGPDEPDPHAGPREPAPRPHLAAREDEVALARLVDETNVKLGDAEGKSRRSVIAHLKAAVAATRADNGLRDARLKDETIERYRDDLARAVRPSRADPATPAPPLPVEAPLTAPQRATPQPATAGTDASFAEFARKTGTAELPELIEAALAHACIVEGVEALPRPRIMQLAASLLPQGAVSTEEGLRCFDQLLQSGRIRKVDGGLFALGDTATRSRAARS